MSRDLPTDLSDAIAEPVVRPFLAIKIDLPDPVYAWTGIGTLTFDDADGISHEWVGAGEIGAIDTIGEATDGSATGIRVTLLNAPSEFRDDIADQATRGALMELYIGSLDLDYKVVVSVVMLWKGRTDKYTITDGGENLSVEIVGESRAIDQRRPAIKRFTDEYQQRKYVGDLFFQYVPQMTEIPILWAKGELSGAASAPVGGGGGGGGLSDSGRFSLSEGIR